jgi:hypothetical protein
MHERKTVTKAMAAQYRRSSKKEKGRILEQFAAATGYNRVYAARVLRGHGRRVDAGDGLVLEGSARPRKRGACGPRRYGPEVAAALIKVWKIMDHICGKRLAPVMPEIVERLVHFGELRVKRVVREKLTTLSAATIDRLLAPERKKYALKGRSRTKPGTLLKHQIPVRTFSDWNEKQPGFLEIDLVAQDGGSAYGEYCQVLDVTDVCTGWSEQAAVLTKAQCFVFEALKAIRGRLPFAVLGLDSDNGAEFLNQQLIRYCDQERITFTRGRSGKKNDNCYVEQKNWSIVRRFSGYGRYEGEQACRSLNQLYGVVRDYVNFFSPCRKLIEKVRDGAKVTKRYDTAQSPYRRVLACADISPQTKARLRSRSAVLNPAQLKREIEALQRALMRHSARLRDNPAPPRRPSQTHPWRAGFRATKDAKKAARKHCTMTVAPSPSGEGVRGKPKAHDGQHHPLRPGDYFGYIFP